jgi:hypothetical protein
MSFLTRARPLTTRVIAPSTYYRSFSTTVAYQRGPVDAAKDTAKAADRKAADAAIKGIETGGTWANPEESGLQSLLANLIVFFFAFQRKLRKR